MYSQTFQEQDYRQLIQKIAGEIKVRTNSFPHFKNFDLENDAFGLMIWYRNNVKHIPNPEYDELIEEEKELDRIQPTRKKRHVPKEIPSYPEEDGIEMTIEITPPEIEKRMARVTLPYTRIAGWAIEVSIEGADTEQLRQIRRIIYLIIDEQKNAFENANKDSQ